MTMMQNRTLALIGGGLLIAALILATVGTVLAQQGRANGGWGAGWPGGANGPMMNGRGPLSPGVSPMRPGVGPMMGGSAQGDGASLGSLSAAQLAFQGYVDRLGNPDLALDEIMEFDQNFYAIVKERSTGNGAMELLASKQTGAVVLEPGPNMMWNTKYGQMGGMMGGAPGSPPTATALTADQIGRIAQQWLDRNQPGSTIEAPDPFYGYDTVHILRDGMVAGMLSVNAYSGQVWYHTWHGAFIGMQEAAG
jgi:hypothetical protein